MKVSLAMLWLRLPYLDQYLLQHFHYAHCICTENWDGDVTIVWRSLVCLVVTFLLSSGFTVKVCGQTTVSNQTLENLSSTKSTGPQPQPGEGRY